MSDIQILHPLLLKKVCIHTCMYVCMYVCMFKNLLKGVMFVTIFFSLKLDISIACEQDTLPLKWSDTTSAICSQVSKSLSRLKRRNAAHKNFLYVLHQVTPTVIIPLVCHVCKIAAELKSHPREKARQSSRCWRITRKQSSMKMEQSSSYIYMCVCVCVCVTFNLSYTIIYNICLECYNYLKCNRYNNSSTIIIL